MTVPDVRTPGGNRANADHGNRENGDSAPATDHVQAERYATLRAELAVRGFTLTLDGSPDAPVYVVARWNRSVDLRDLDHVEAFLHSVGGRP